MSKWSRTWISKPRCGKRRAYVVTPLTYLTIQNLIKTNHVACFSEILGHLRNTLKSRNKHIQIGILEKYRRICANSPSACPPLPITGIKACLAILKIIKPNTRPDAIDRLANVFETWRTMLLDDAGPVIAGLDSIWKCKALKQLVAQTTSVKSQNPSVSHSAPTNRYFIIPSLSSHRCAIPDVFFSTFKSG